MGLWEYGVGLWGGIMGLQGGIIGLWDHSFGTLGLWGRDWDYGITERDYDIMGWHFLYELQI